MQKIILKLSLASVLLIALEACSSSGTSTPTQTPRAGVPITGGRSATLTPPAVQVHVAVDTNCRMGPGDGYPVISGFFVGQVAEVIGRSSNKAYWVIRDPNQHGELCWLAGNFATLTGNADALPAFPTPPTPIPTFTPPTSPMPLSTP